MKTKYSTKIELNEKGKEKFEEVFDETVPIKTIKTGQRGYLVDINRLSPTKKKNLAEYLSDKKNMDIKEAKTEIKRLRSIVIREKWVEDAFSDNFPPIIL